MVTRKRKTAAKKPGISLPDNQLAQAVTQSAQKIWLAGLGAFAQRTALDVGLQPEARGVGLLKPMPDLEPLLKRAVALGGTSGAPLRLALLRSAGPNRLAVRAQ